MDAWRVEDIELPARFALAHRIAEAARERGWRVLIVGGWPRDQIVGVESKDVDLEVYKADPQELGVFLARFGQVDLVGKSFGVYKLYTDVGTFDVSVPRRESKHGRLHQDFTATPGPDMSIEEAASRRDFTINAIAYDPLTGEFIDPFGGKDDLKHGRLRATSEAFQEDPLRVLRGMQFAGRFVAFMDIRTALMCEALHDEFSTIPVERVWEEWSKWAERSAVPSYGLFTLTFCKWLDHWPALLALMGCEQEKQHHPEGDAWVHTVLVTDEMANILDREGVTDDDRLVPMFAALLHDVGKPATTEVIDGKITTYGHDKEGEGPATEFLESIGAPAWVIEQVIPLVKEHMWCVHNRKPSARSVRRLARRLGKASIRQLLWVMEADQRGRPPKSPKMLPAADELERIAEAEKAKDEAPAEILMGRHLIEVGMEPGPRMGVCIAGAYEAQLDGEFSDVEGALLWLGESELLDKD